MMDYTREPMTIQQAVEVLKRDHSPGVHTPGGSSVCTLCMERRAALAALDGVNIYGSRYAIGDECWEVWMPNRYSPWTVRKAIFTYAHLNPTWLGVLRPTRSAAEQACRARNEKGADRSE